jgi:hypothetical protein
MMALTSILNFFYIKFEENGENNDPLRHCFCSYYFWNPPFFSIMTEECTVYSVRAVKNKISLNHGHKQSKKLNLRVCLVVRNEAKKTYFEFE